MTADHIQKTENVCLRLVAQGLGVPEAASIPLGMINRKRNRDYANEDMFDETNAQRVSIADRISLVSKKETKVKSMAEGARKLSKVGHLIGDEAQLHGAKDLRRRGSAGQGLHIGAFESIEPLPRRNSHDPHIFS